MKINMGKADQNIRISLAMIIALLYFTDFISGTLALVLIVLAGIFFITRFIGFCTLYIPIGLNTSHKERGMKTVIYIK